MKRFTQAQQEVICLMLRRAENARIGLANLVPGDFPYPEYRAGFEIFSGLAIPKDPDALVDLAAWVFVMKDRLAGLGLHWSISDILEAMRPEFAPGFSIEEGIRRLKALIADPTAELDA